MSLIAKIQRIKRDKTRLTVVCPSSQKPDHLLPNEKIHYIQYIHRQLIFFKSLSYLIFCINYALSTLFSSLKFLWKISEMLSKITMFLNLTRYLSGIVKDSELLSITRCVWRQNLNELYIFSPVYQTKTHSNTHTHTHTHTLFLSYTDTSLTKTGS